MATLAVVAAAAFIDSRTERIPNWLSLGALAVALGAHAVGGWREGLLSLVGAIACAAYPVALHRRGEIGGGDVKIFAAIGAALLAAGPTAVLASFCIWKTRRPRIRVPMGPSILGGVAIASLLELAYARM